MDMTERAQDNKNLENLGNMLKTQREINGMTRRDVVVKTKIPLEQLESIEDGRLSSLPPVFAKGFLRVYATELGLDAEALLEDYRQMTGGFKNEPASREPLAPKYIETSVGSNMAPLIKFLLLLLLIIAALGGAFWFSPNFRATAVSMFPALEGISPDAEEIAPAPEVAVESASEVQSAANAVQPTAPPAATEEAAAVTPTESAPEAAAPQQPLGGTLILTSNKDNIWAQIAIDGAAPEFHYFKSGQKTEFTAKESIVVTAGQAQALAVNWNGEELGPLAETTVAEITFPRS